MEANGRLPSWTTPASTIWPNPNSITDLMPRVRDYDKWAIGGVTNPSTAPKMPKKTARCSTAGTSKSGQQPAPAFSDRVSAYDPRAQSEDLGDNSMTASEYGIKNLQRILPQPSGQKEAKTYGRADGDLQQCGGPVHAATSVMSPNGWAACLKRQKPTIRPERCTRLHPPTSSATRWFSCTSICSKPQWLLDPACCASSVPTTAWPPWPVCKTTRSRVCSAARLQRMIENEALDPNTYTAANLFDDLRTGIWSEIPARTPVRVHRRNLQKTFVDKMIGLYQPSPATATLHNTDVPSLALNTLRQLRTDLTAAYNASNDAMSRSHYLDCLERIENVLEQNRRR
ncbi:MAG: zinc-dependent metalloprotease [Lewinellaceae bacterium]|nr:zinc-dependent metalloprotease [Lewinellaceae bacterium]